MKYSMRVCVCYVYIMRDCAETELFVRQRTTNLLFVYYSSAIIYTQQHDHILEN